MRSICIHLVFLTGWLAAPVGATLIEAHRGNSLAAPENTLASIQAASGFADLTEMDVRVTEDEKLVLMHDASLQRTTDGRGAIRRRSLSEVESLDAGSWFSNDYLGEPVPTLEQAIQSAFSVGIVPLIERKAGDARLYHQEFQRLGLNESQFRVISFSRRFIADLHEINPNYNLGILGFGAITSAKLRRLNTMGADFISWWHNNVRRQSTVDLVHASGMELHVWTVNHPNRMQQLLDFGVDGITTDDPELLFNVMNGSLVAPDTSMNESTHMARFGNKLGFGNVVQVPETDSTVPLFLSLLLLWHDRRPRQTHVAWLRPGLAHGRHR